MQNITIKPFIPAFGAPLMKLQSAYAAVYPGATVIPEDVYLSPLFENGQNIFCAIDECGNLSGYAPLYPVLIRDPSGVPHTFWVEIKTHPTCTGANEIKDRLFERILLRTQEVAEEFPGHPVHLTFQYLPSERASIEYVLSKGAQYTESVFTMKRDLSQEIPPMPPLQAIHICPWRMETEAEQRLYVQARSECFPEAPVTLEEWQYFMQSPQWSDGTTFAAFDGEELVGNVAVFWDKAENQKLGTKIGFTEYIFVRSNWRGKKIARYLINSSLAYLKQNGLREAHLDVRAENENALRLYADLGYEVIRESRFYVLKLEER